MLLGELDLSGAGALKTLHHLDEKFSGLLGTFAKFGAIAGGGFAAFESVHLIMEGFEGTLQLAEHMIQLHHATGESVHDLVILNHALTLTGAGADTAQGFLFKLQQSISGVNEEGKATATAFRMLGVSQQQLAGHGALEQIEMLSAGFARIGSQADKAAVAGDLFGKRMGAQALRIFANPEAFETAKKQAEPLAAAIDKNAEKFAELGHAIAGVKLNFNEFFAGALEGVAPEATDIATALASIDFVGIGRMAGALLGVVLHLGEVFIWMAPAINAVSQALGEMSRSGAVLGAVLGGIAGLLVGGPVAALLGAVGGGFAGSLFGGGEDGEHHGFAEGFRGLGAVNSEKSAPVGSLQKVGGGGGFGGGDPLLGESRRQTGLLGEIRDALRTRPNPEGYGTAGMEVAV